MRRYFHVSSFCVAVCACLAVLAAVAPAATIVKLDLGDDNSQDIFFDGTFLQTIDDGFGPTTGEQRTGIEFLSLLSSEADVDLPPGSFTLAGMVPSGPPLVIGGLVIQEFTGGTFDLYGQIPDGGTPILSGTLDKSTLSGPLGPPAAGGLFTTTFGSFTGGPLAAGLDPNSLALSMSLTDINGGAGLAVGDGGMDVMLYPFNADVTLNISATPEPSSILLALLASGILVVARARREC